MSSSSIFPATSRRGVLKGILASAAAGAPVAVQSKTLSDEEQLEACVADLRNILARMHPGVSIIHPHYYSSREDGSFRFHLQGDVEFEPFQGDGVYIISLDGILVTAIVREESVVALNGKREEVGWSRYYARVRWYDDFEKEERYIAPSFVRKLEGASL